MDKKRLLLILGLSFVIISFLPICLPPALSIAFFIKTGRLVYDILMPAELFLFTLIGGGGMIALMLLNKESYKNLIIFTTLATLNIVVSQIYADLSGLAHGETKPVGIHLIAITIFVTLYHLLAFLVALECSRTFKEITK